MSILLSDDLFTILVLKFQQVYFTTCGSPYYIVLKFLQVHISTCSAGTQRLDNVDSTLIQRLDVESTFNRRCFNVLCMLGVELLAIIVLNFRVHFTSCWSPNYTWIKISTCPFDLLLISLPFCLKILASILLPFGPLSLLLAGGGIASVS